MAEAPYNSYEDSTGVVNSFAYISVPGLVQNKVAANVDPQSWDECSTFWPRPALGLPSDSASLADVTANPNTCTVTLPGGVSLKTRPAGSVYGPEYFYEHFRCAISPCDAEFKNILSVRTSMLPHTVAAGTVMGYHVHYGLPMCVAAGFNGGIWGRVGTTAPVRNVTDWGNLDVWEPGPRTHVMAEKHVAFDNGTYTSTYAAMLQYTELNKQLAEIACCRRGH
jgi:hypothetical protein